MARTSYSKDQMIADWKTGEYSERSLAHKHKVSPATAHNVVSGIPKSLEPLISAQIEIKQALTNFNEQEVSTFEQVVDSRTKHLQFFTEAAVLNVKASMAVDCGNQQDFKHRADTILKGRETVLGKAADPQAQTTVNILTMSNGELERIARGN